MNMNINTIKYQIIFTDHIFDYRKDTKRIGELTKENIRELIRVSMDKTDFLNYGYKRFLITYPRTNDCYSAILVSKEKNTFVIVTVVHSEYKYKRQGLLPNEKISIDLTIEETNNAMIVNSQPNKDIIVRPLIRKIRKVN